MKFICNLFLLLATIQVRAQYDTYYLKNYEAHCPPFEKVIDTFFSAYSPDNLPDGEYIAFEKRPEGWLIDIRKAPGISVLLQKEILWDATDNGYKEVHFEKRREDSKPKDEWLNWCYTSSDTMGYSRNLYNGYYGWEKDVIHILEPIKKLDDLNLNYLARAYSNNGGAMLWPSTRYHTYLGYDSNFEERPIPDALVDEFREYNRKGIETYMKLQKQNPGFQTIVGNIEAKIASEYMDAFLELSVAGRPDIALKILPDSLYSPYAISIGKMVLQDCEPNAIIFTGGDFDSYLLNYVQAKLGYRKDITIIISGLISDGRYIHYLSHVLPQQNRIKLTLGDKAYKLDNNDYLLENLKKPQEDAADFLMQLGGEAEHSGEYTFQTIQIPVSPHSGIAGDTLKLDMPQQYMFKNMLFFIDMLATDKLRRPVYFTPWTGELFGSTQYWCNEGFRLKMVPVAQWKKDYLKYLQPHSIAKAILKDSFPLDTFMDYTVHTEYKSYLNTVKNNFGLLAEYYIGNSQEDSALYVINKYFDKFLVGHVPYGPVDEYMLEFCFMYIREDTHLKSDFRKLTESVSMRIADRTDKILSGRTSSHYSAAETDQAVDYLKSVEDMARVYYQDDLYKKLSLRLKNARLKRNKR